MPTRTPPLLCCTRPAEQAALVSFGGFELNLHSGALSRDGIAVVLTAGAVAMLKALAHRPREPLSREALARLTRTGGVDEPLHRSIDLQVSRLRKCIEPDPAVPRFIQTVRGFGYVFEPNGAVRCWSSASARSPATHPVSSRPMSWCSLV